MNHIKGAFFQLVKSLWIINILQIVVCILKTLFEHIWKSLSEFSKRNIHRLFYIWITAKFSIFSQKT